MKKLKDMNKFMKIGHLAILFAIIMASMHVQAQEDEPIPVYPNAITYGCNGADITDDIDANRVDPEWVIMKEGVVLEGRIPYPYEIYPDGETSNDEGVSQIAYHDSPWAHYTHDQTIFVFPDPGYKYLLSSYIDKNGNKVNRKKIEVEWENAAKMNLGTDHVFWWNNWNLGAIPIFVWPSAGDRVWINGRWVFDCGHPYPDSKELYGNKNDLTNIAYNTEVHPPRAIVTFRLNYIGGNLLKDPFNSFSSDVLNMPVTGLTGIPLTQADIFVSGFGGAVADRCVTTYRNYYGFGEDGCVHTSPVTPVNDANYIFDIYPPGTDFDPSHKLSNGVYKINSMTRDGNFNDISLQWLVIDQTKNIPPKSCDPCKSVDPIIIPIDENTPPPDQSKENGGIIVPTNHPTRLRVILPFKNSDANVFAKTILLGWDDVPKPPCTATTEKTLCAPIRNFKVNLHEFKVITNGENWVKGDGDWYVFTDVGGQWRFMSDKSLFDKDNSGNNICKGDELTDVADGDCFEFDNIPWQTRIQDGTPIHVAFTGWQSNDIDNMFCSGDVIVPTPTAFCGDHPPWPLLLNVWAYGGDDEPIGVLEFDFLWNDYLNAIQGSWGQANKGNGLEFTTQPISGDGEQYKATFYVSEMSPPLAPDSYLDIGDPKYTNDIGQTFVTSFTRLTIMPHGYLGDQEAMQVQYRYYRDGTPLPIYTYINPGLTSPNSEAMVPAYWQNAPVPAYVDIVKADGEDGQYILQFSARKIKSANFMAIDTEPRHTVLLRLDNTKPNINLAIGDPNILRDGSLFLTNKTLLTLSATDEGSGIRSISYRFFPKDDIPPAYAAINGESTQFSINGLDGIYEIDIQATDNVGNTIEKNQFVYLDDTPPLITIIQPSPSQFAHSDIITLNYTVDDIAGSGVKEFIPTLDGMNSIAGHSLQSGQAIDLLTELIPGSHTFAISAVDNLQNSDQAYVNFTIIVTEDSIKEDVNRFFSNGAIKDNGIVNSLLAKLNTSADAKDCQTSGNIYQAYINEILAQKGKGIDANAADIMITDAKYLIDNCSK